VISETRETRESVMRISKGSKPLQHPFFCFGELGNGGEENSLLLLQGV
jgi:hypothetical protein